MQTMKMQTKDTDEDIKNEDTDDEDIKRNMPAWYLYYFTCTGHGMELSLPDIKGEKDIFYFWKGVEDKGRHLTKEEAEGIAEVEAQRKEEGEEFNDSAPRNLPRFMKVFEDNKTREMRKMYEAWANYNERERILRDDLDVLMHTDEDIPIEENENWEHAIQIAASRHRPKKILEVLPAAYEQYKMNLSLGISFPEYEQGKKDADFYNDLLLLGRKMLGEPEDFEY
jgi:hypothetical protein